MSGAPTEWDSWTIEAGPDENIFYLRSFSDMYLGIEYQEICQWDGWEDYCRSEYVAVLKPDPDVEAEFEVVPDPQWFDPNNALAFYSRHWNAYLSARGGDGADVSVQTAGLGPWEVFIPEGA